MRLFSSTPYQLQLRQQLATAVNSRTQGLELLITALSQRQQDAQYTMDSDALLKLFQTILLTQREQNATLALLAQKQGVALNRIG